MEYTGLELRIEDHIATIAMNRPAVMNAMNTTAYAEIHRAIDACAEDDNVKVVVITGRGKHFSAGGDIKEFDQVFNGGGTADAEEITKSAKMAAAVKCCPKPVIAMVNGLCVGAACSTAMACDFRFVTPRTKFIMAFINMGLSGDTGALYYLMKLVGAEKALYMMATAEPVLGEESVRIGLASKLCMDDEELERETYAFARRLAEGPTIALRKQKQLMLDYWYQDLPQYTWTEAVYMEECFKTKDFLEAVNAFLNKRPPKFKGE